MTNYEWLLQMDGDARKSWFDAEHVENQERALDGDTAALNARINELRAREREFRELCRQILDERDSWKANCEDWKKDCERYRKKFGKCIDYADAIHALMDEGMA